MFREAASMLTKKGVANVDIPLEHLWKLISNLEKLGRVFSEVEEVQVIDTKNYESIWFFKVNVGFVNLKFRARSRVLDMVQNKYVHFIVESEYMDIDGYINLIPVDNSTLVEVILKSFGKSRLKLLIENIMKKKFDEEMKLLDKKLSFLYEEGL